VQAGGVELGLVRAECGAGDLGQVGVGAVQRQRGGLGGGQVGEVLDDPAEAQGLVVQSGEAFGVRLSQAVAEFFEAGLQGGERGA
jgi:hypothetical protein